MTRAISLTLVLLAITAALPAAAQESGGLRLRGNPIATLNQASRSMCKASVGRWPRQPLLGEST
jgi:hypothetical protein